MQCDLWQRRFGWTCLAAIILISGALAQQKHAAADDGDDSSGAFNEAQRLFAQAPNNAFQGPEWQRYLDLAVNGETGKYWIGVECREAQPELKSQLGLKDDEGLVVIHVAEEGPATKAGIKQHDLIVSAGDTKLAHPADLVKAVNAAGGKELSLKIIRGGKEQTIAVTPAERQHGTVNLIARPGQGFIFSGPPGAPHVDLPDNVTVTVVHHGKDPGKITVTRGDDKWEITDQELNKLPDDLRPLVGQLIGGGPLAPFMGGNNPNSFFQPPGIRVEGMPMGPPGMNPPPPDGNGPPGHGGDGPPHDGKGPPHDGKGPPRNENGPPPHDGRPQSRDGNSLPPFAQPMPPGYSPPPAYPPRQYNQLAPNAAAGALPPEMMQRFDELDRRLDMLQQEIQRLHVDGTDGMPRMHPRPEDSMPHMQPRGPDSGRNGPPGLGGPPPNDGQRQGPPGGQ
ncbi:MAG TPA: PDZ domain-containing protein [Pirellulales bacterium]|nr:PDZ domain-containing protein [Pirellulales bacterium]